MQSQITAQQLKAMSKDDAIEQIRKILAFDGPITRSLRTPTQDHFRFDMSGYESTAGACTIHNLMVLNKFAFLGIYDYTKFLALDFYKGQGTLYFCYWNEMYSQEEEFGGLGTCEIIYEIFERTIFTDKPTRRR